MLCIGAVDLTLFETGVYASIEEYVTGVQVYSRTALESRDSLDTHAISQLTDVNGIIRFFKNSISIVHF